MQKNSLFLKFFSSGLQAIAVQILGSIFFYIISIYLTKDVFGMISWMNAVCLFITTILGFGLEQVVTRRIAASDRSDWAAAAFLVHSVAGVTLTLLILFLLGIFIHGQNPVWQLLPYFFAAQGLVSIGVPLKQYLNAKERFTPYGVIAVLSNIGKIIVAFWLLHLHLLNIRSVAFILIISAAFEFGSLLIYIRIKTDLMIKFPVKAYLKLLRESSAQYISVIFDTSLSRMDWILLGVLTTNVVLADYSFAYRAYELSRLPVIIIGPMILPRFSRIMAGGHLPDPAQRQQIDSFTRVELSIAMLIVLMLNILWVPVVGAITHGKYGAGNSLQFMLLTCCIPLQFFINLLWSISFGAKRYRQVTTITIICAVTNIVADLVLIPLFGGLGAAIGFLASTLLQALLYYRLVNKHLVQISINRPFLFFTLAIAVYLAVGYLKLHFLIQLVLSAGIYAGLLFGAKQVNRTHIANFKQFLTR